GYNPLIQGAGFLDTLGAVRLARFYATTQPGQRVPVQSLWSKRVIWGNHLLSGGVLNPLANAFALGTTWGAAKTSGGDNIVWGTSTSGTSYADLAATSSLAWLDYYLRTNPYLLTDSQVFQWIASATTGGF